jgi:hypothetical protein
VKRTPTFVLLLSLMALTTIVPMQQVLADTAQNGPRVGDVFEIASVRGMAYERTTDGPIEAKVSLKLAVTDVNGSRVKFKIVSGEMKIGDKTYTATDGRGGALIGKFGWATLQGNATLTRGQVFKFRLEGMLHFERTGLVLTGLTGVLGNDTEQFRLRLLMRLTRS